MLFQCSFVSTWVKTAAISLELQVPYHLDHADLFGGQPKVKIVFPTKTWYTILFCDCDILAHLDETFVYLEQNVGFQNFLIEIVGLQTSLCLFSLSSAKVMAIGTVA